MKTPPFSGIGKRILDREVKYIEDNLCPYWRSKCEHKKEYGFFDLGPWYICPFIETANKINNLFEKKEVKKSFYDKVLEFFKFNKETKIENKRKGNLTTKVISSETYLC